MGLVLIREDYYEILKILKKGEQQSSKLAELITSVSVSEAYKRIKKLEKLGLIEGKPSLNERGQPIKVYHLTKAGIKVFEKLKELELVLTQELNNLED